MKRCLLFLLTVFALQVHAQIPVNDDCAGIIDFSFAPACDTVNTYTNVDATPSSVYSTPSDNIPSCWDNVNNDVWFQFTVPADGSIIDFTVYITGDDTNGNSIFQPQLAVYRGDCELDGLAELLCIKSDVGENNLQLDLLGLTPGLDYFLRVDAYSATATPNWGEFNVCVDTLAVENLICDGGSASLEGTLFDSGGSDGDYSNNENCIFTICPPIPNNECITFNLTYYNIEENTFNSGDVLNFYQGDGAVGSPIASIGGNGINAGGGVCFTVQTTECLTIEFLSDGNNTFEGFEGSWTSSAQPCVPPASIQINNTVTPDQIEAVIASPETTVTIDTIICTNGAYGTFVGDNSDLGLEQGLILTSGFANNALGPNTQTGITGANGAPGDVDLDYLSDLFNGGNGPASFDACIVELDVFAATDELAFEYVFGSEEYLEFAQPTSSFNDIFAFLISGPGIVGDPGMNNQLNIATLPGTTDPVQILSVNNYLNWQYYRNNEAGVGVEYDGLTSDFLGVKKSLTARADVIPCNEYHLKLAVADRGDGILDSGVFISDIKGGTPEVAFNSIFGIDYLIEACSGTNETFTFSVPNEIEEAFSFVVRVSGTATAGVDYLLNVSDGDTLTIQPGQQSIDFNILPIEDNIPEPTETIILQLTNNFGCGDITYFELVIELEDQPVVEINQGADTAFVCVNSGATLNVEGAATYFWTPVNVFPNSDPSSPNPYAEPIVDQMVNVVGQVGPCVDEDSIWLQIIDPQVQIDPLTVTDICEGTSISLQATNNVNDLNLIWTPDGNLPDPNAPIITDTPPITTTYTATVQLQGCSDTDTYTVNVDPFDFPTLTTTDTTLCQSYSFDAAAPIPGTTTTYSWTPDDGGLSCLDCPNPVVTAEGDVTYTVVATSQNGYCSESATVHVLAIPADVDITNDDYIEICLGESVDLLANTSTAGAGFTWQSFPLDPTLNPLTDTTVTVTPTISTAYVTELIVGACIVYDSIYVRVDSLPDLSLVAIPEKDIYCAGDIISIVSPTYEPSHFPDIMHQWVPEPSIQSDIENLNLVIIADVTTTYMRSIVNRACEEESSILIEVVDPFLELTLTDTTVCEDEPVAVAELLGENHVWTPDDGSLSCADCPDPVITVSDTATFMVTGTISDCPASAEMTINVAPNPAGFITTDPAGLEILQGTDLDVLANITNPTGGPETYDWTLNGFPLGTTNPTVAQIVEENNTFTVTVVNEFGCTSVFTLDITGLLPEFDAPNVFTPDSDGTNDFFNITFYSEGLHVEQAPLEIPRFTVFNRWGQIVYNNETPATGWDGNHNGEPAPSDVYIYIIDVVKPNGELINFKGDVSLIR